MFTVQNATSVNFSKQTRPNVAVTNNNYYHDYNRFSNIWRMFKIDYLHLIYIVSCSGYGTR